MTRSLALVLLFAGVVTLDAQAPPQAPPQGPTFRAGVDVISLDVAVVDSQGRPVPDLLAAEFSVRVDGQPRRVVSVQHVKVDVEAAKQRQADEPFESLFSTNITPPEGRLIVIAVDELNIRPGNVRPLLNEAAKFVDNLSPADRIAFYAYPQPGAFVDFTTDRARLRRAMETVTGNQVPYQGRFNIGLYEAVQVMLKQDERMLQRVVARECRRAAAAALELCEQELQQEMSRMVAKVRDDRHASLNGLQELLERLRLIDGPKALLIVSEGLVLEDRTDLDDTVRQAAMAQASVNVLIMDVQRGSDMSRGVMPPTMTEDRELQVDGLREMAFSSRGDLYNVLGNGENVFNRLASELSAYYLLGVEADPRDRDDKPHRLDVEVRRRGVTLRSRKAFVLSSPRNRTPAERLSDVLFSPFGVPEIPLRITTFAMQEPGSSKVRLLLAADVGQPGAAAARYTLGWAFIDRDGKVVSTGSERQLLRPTAGRTDTALDFSTSVLLDPGTYGLRFGVADEEGRRGSVVREVNAWKLAGEEFAVADLVVGRPPENGAVSVLAGIEPHVDGAIAALLEIYSTAPATFGRTAVTFEIAEGQESAALLTVRGQLQARSQPSARAVQAIVDARALPAGRYVMRARITRDGSPVGLLARPFVLDARPAAVVAGVPVPQVPRAFVDPRFDRAVALAPALTRELFDSIEKRAPAMKGAIAEARAGRYGAGALEALSEGDQAVAAFLRGLDLYTRGQLDQAAGQLAIAAGPRREFFPAAFFLGAAFAEAGKDRDAAAVWQLGIGEETRPSIAYTLFADARFRDNQPQSVIDVLQPAFARLPQDEAIARRLADAYLMTGKHAEAVPVLDALLARRPDDQDLLFAAIVAQYEVTMKAGVGLSSLERAKLTRYERAYRGPQKALAAKYLETMISR